MSVFLQNKSRRCPCCETANLERLELNMLRPSVDELSTNLLAFLQDKQDVIQLANFDANWRQSGVYAVLDCVFSAQAKFDSVVVPTLKRFSENSGLEDHEELTFTEFLNFLRGQQIERPDEARFVELARDVFGNSQKISGRTKVEVAYDVCEFFAAQGYETKAELQALPSGIPFTCQNAGEAGELEKQIMNRMVNGTLAEGKVRGMGLALGAYLLICLGRTDFVKPDTLLLRLVGRIGATDWQPKSGDIQDYLLVRQAISCVAERLDYSAAGLDNALWRYETDLSSGKLQPSEQ